MAIVNEIVGILLCLINFLYNDIGQNLQFNFCNYLILISLCKKKNVTSGLGDLFPCFKMLLMFFRLILVSVMVRY